MYRIIKIDYVLLLTMARFTETKTRTLLKAIILRFIIFILTTIVVLLNGGTFMQSIELCMLDVCLELGTNYVYERIWQYIDWGIVQE